MEDSVKPTSTIRAFLSHSTQNRDWIRALAADLMRAGIDVWYSEWEIRPGDSFRRKIDAGIEQATHFIVAVTPESLASEWVSTELDGGMVKRIEGSAKLIPIVRGVPFRDLPVLLRAVLCISFENHEEGLHQLIDACYGRNSRPPVAQPLERIEDQLGTFRVSADATRMAKWISEHSETGTPYETFDRDPILNDLGLSAAAARLAAVELEQVGWVIRDENTGSGPARFSSLDPTAQFFWDTDAAFQGWDPAEDSLALATALVNHTADGFVPLRDMSDALKWSPRRLNPAAMFLDARGHAEGSKGMGSHPFAFHDLYVDDKTMLYARRG